MNFENLGFCLIKRCLDERGTWKFISESIPNVSRANNPDPCTYIMYVRSKACTHAYPRATEPDSQGQYEEDDLKLESLFWIKSFFRKIVINF